MFNYYFTVLSLSMCLSHELFIYSVGLVVILFPYVYRASALFVGVYEPTKQKLLQIFPENLSAAAHLVRESLILSILALVYDCWWL